MSILLQIPSGARELDLGAARAARAEARAASGEGNPFLKLAAGYVEIKAEIALTVAFAFQNKDIKGGLEGMLVDPADVDALLADGLSSDDLKEISKFVTGASLGELPASPKP